MLNLLHFKPKKVYWNNHWNKCDVCGRFISFEDFHNGKALRAMTLPDSELTTETYETLCPKHNK